MAVIINEFQIVVADSAQRGGAGAGASGAPGSAAPNPGAAAEPIPGPREILDVLRHYADRMARLRAD